ncbi:hypothetical protein DPEC_G00361460 [Dallia pectoralis]|nr:hypothetical protein DPEC_G00361460 [Dallia pectoralis]
MMDFLKQPAQNLSIDERMEVLYEQRVILDSVNSALASFRFASSPIDEDQRLQYFAEVLPDFISDWMSECCWARLPVINRARRGNWQCRVHTIQETRCSYKTSCR